MFIRNFSFISLLLIASYSPNLSAHEQIQTSDASAIASQASGVDDLFGEDDAFDNITIDLNHKPQKLPFWKSAGAWLFMKIYWPVKRALAWWHTKNKCAHAKR